MGFSGHFPTGLARPAASQLYATRLLMIKVFGMPSSDIAVSPPVPVFLFDTTLSGFWTCPNSIPTLIISSPRCVSLRPHLVFLLAPPHYPHPGKPCLVPPRISAVATVSRRAHLLLTRHPMHRQERTPGIFALDASSNASSGSPYSVYRDEIAISVLPGGWDFRSVSRQGLPVPASPSSGNGFV